MIAVFDVGNTETTVGVFDGETLAAHWRLTTESNRTPDEIGVLLTALLGASGLTAERIRRAAIGSVVPQLTSTLVDACISWLGVRPVVVDASSDLPIVLQVDEPLTVGADRLINTLAASRMYNADTIVVDLGTATTYDCITASGVFLGGIIAPGLRSSAETLFRRTSKLPATELVAPARAIGTRTEECIRAGVLFGAVDSADGLVKRIKAEWPTGDVPRVVATGGYAELLAPLSAEIEHVEPFLTLHGLRIAHALLTEVNRS